MYNCAKLTQIVLLLASGWKIMQEKKINIGILIGEYTCSKYLFETISELNKLKQVTLYFLISPAPIHPKQNIIGKFVRTVKRGQILKKIRWKCFSKIMSIEHRIVSKRNSQLSDHYDLKNLELIIANYNSLRLHANYSKTETYVTYNSDDIDKVKSLDLNLIIRGNAQGIFKGDILNASKHGIISFHHGDNRWNRGGPPGFWEVLWRKSSTGFIIQILTEKLDQGKVIFRGSLATKSTYTENIKQLYSESNPMLFNLIRKIISSDQLHTIEKQIETTSKILKVPSLLYLTIYIAKTIGSFSYAFFRRYILRKRLRWTVFFRWKNNKAKDKFIKIKNPKGHFYADPFVWRKDDVNVCFVEDYDYSTQKATISAVELSGNKSKILGPVIKEDFHLSFPFLFEFENELYMVPESVSSGSIRLYRCIEYPLKWEFQHELMTDIKAADTMIFEYNSSWWLFTNEGVSDHCSQLNIYTSDSPVSTEWKSHTNNPVIFNSELGRNAGLITTLNGEIFRIRQEQGFNTYGKGFSISKLITLTLDQYKEEEVELNTFLPNEFDCKNTHHISKNDEYIVFDQFSYDWIK